MNFKITNEFSKNNCYLAARFSEAVYDIDKLKALSQELGMECIVYNVDNHRAAICKRHDFAVIVYCGTNDFKDFITDGKYFQRQLPKLSAMVHIGVDKAYNALSVKMAGELRKIFISNRNWIICGHSLGGGIAERSLVGLKNPNGYCYTFGAMRTGNRAMAVSISVPRTRVVNGNDLVPHLPFKKMVVSGFKYHHGGDVIHLNHDGTITMGGRSLWGNVKEWATGIFGDLTDIDVIPDNIEDHSMDDYVSILAQWEGK